MYNEVPLFLTHDTARPHRLRTATVVYRYEMRQERTTFKFVKAVRTVGSPVTSLTIVNTATVTTGELVLSTGGHAFNHTINQSINRSINQSTNWSTN